MWQNYVLTPNDVQKLYRERESSGLNQPYKLFKSLGGGGGENASELYASKTRGRWIDIQNIDIGLSKTFTIEMILLFNSVRYYNSILSIGDSFHLWTIDGEKQLDIDGGDTDYGVFNLNEFYRLMIVYKDSTFTVTMKSLYSNNLSEIVCTKDYEINSNLHIQIGKNSGYDYHSPFDGYISEVNIYNKDLTFNQLEANNAQNNTTETFKMSKKQLYPCPTGHFCINGEKEKCIGNKNYSDRISQKSCLIAPPGYVTNNEYILNSELVRTYSSVWDSDHNKSLLDDGLKGAWCAGVNNTSQWTLADLGYIRTVNRIIIQKRGGEYSTQYVTKLKVQYSDDGTNWIWVEGENIFDASQTTDHKDYKRSIYFNSSFNCRYIKIHPTEYISHISMRYGIGVVNNEVENTGITSCPAGTKEFDGQCVKCTGNFVNDVEGQTMCYKCTDGLEAKNHNTYCGLCNVGEYKGSSMDSCENADYGYYAVNGGTSQEICPVGHKCNGGRKTECAAGTYQNNAGGTSCINCVAGTYSGSTGQSSCIQ